MTGLVYIGMGIGFISGILLVARISDVTILRMTKANAGCTSLRCVYLLVCSLDVLFRLHFSGMVGRQTRLYIGLCQLLDSFRSGLAWWGKYQPNKHFIYPKLEKCTKHDWLQRFYPNSNLSHRLLPNVCRLCRRCDNISALSSWRFPATCWTKPFPELGLWLGKQSLGFYLRGSYPGTSIDLQVRRTD